MMKKEYICPNYPIYGALLMIPCFSWIFIVGILVGIIITIMGYIPYQYDHVGIYIVCYIFAWISIPVIVKYSKGMVFAKRLL